MGRTVASQGGGGKTNGKAIWRPDGAHSSGFVSNFVSPSPLSLRLIRHELVRGAADRPIVLQSGDQSLSVR